MSEQECLRPGCRTTMPTVGVCVKCAHSSWDPEVSGVELKHPDGTREVTDGWKS